MPRRRLEAFPVGAGQGTGVADASLWACGRVALDERPSLGADWEWHCAPLEEWEGEVPAMPVERPVAFRYDGAARRWLPVTRPDRPRPSTPTTPLA